MAKGVRNKTSKKNRVLKMQRYGPKHMARMKLIAEEVEKNLQEQVAECEEKKRQEKIAARAARKAEASSDKMETESVTSQKAKKLRAWKPKVSREKIVSKIIKKKKKPKQTQRKWFTVLQANKGM